MSIIDSNLFAHLMRSPIASQDLQTIQYADKKRITTQRGRIAHQQQLAPCVGYAHVQAEDVRQKTVWL